MYEGTRGAGDGPSYRVGPRIVGEILSPDLPAYSEPEVSPRSGPKGPSGGGVPQRGPVPQRIPGHLSAIEVAQHQVIPNVATDLPAGPPGERKERFGELGLADVAVTQVGIQKAHAYPTGKQAGLPEDGRDCGTVGIALVPNAGQGGGA